MFLCPNDGELGGTSMCVVDNDMEGKDRENNTFKRG